MKILLADDTALLREGLAGLLAAAGHEVVARVSDADALRAEVTRLARAGRLPDVVVTDVRMPPTGTDDGLRAAVDLRAAYPGLPVVVLSAYVVGPYLRDLLGSATAPDGGAGAVGYLLKERVGRVEDFLRSLDVVAAGGVVVDPEVLARLMGAPARTPAQADAERVARLTEREREVLALMAEGLSNAQIAGRLVLSDGAVAKHVANILAKLDLPPGENNRRVRAVLTWLRTTA